MRLTGSGTSGIDRYHWEWLAGQGAYYELTEVVKACRDPGEFPGLDADFSRMRDVWNEMWPTIGFGVEEKMRHPISKAVFLIRCSTDMTRGTLPWSSLYLVHPDMTALADCRLIVTGARTMGKPKNDAHQTMSIKDRIFMEAMAVKFWDPAFANKQLSKKPLPPPPPLPHATQVGGTRSTRGALIGIG